MDEKLGQHYSGEKGETYSQWQVMATKALGKLVAPKFANFIPPEATVIDSAAGAGRIFLGRWPSASASSRIPLLSAPSPERYHGNRPLSSVADASVDVVMSHHALEHCLAPLNELREIATC